MPGIRTLIICSGCMFDGTAPSRQRADLKGARQRLCALATVPRNLFILEPGKPFKVYLHSPTHLTKFVPYGMNLSYDKNRI
jgi:hypothetical protein